LPESSEARFVLGVLPIWSNEHRALEEDLLTLPGRDLVTLPVLVNVPRVPLKTCALRELLGPFIHVASI
jgi:hypothetical protein